MHLRIIGNVLAAVIAVLAWSAAASACDFDHSPTSRWSVIRENGVAWLKTPCGDRFYSLGVNILDGGYAEHERDGRVFYSWKAFAPSVEAWVGDTRKRLSEWGFNSAGGWSLSPHLLHLPAVIDLELGRNAKFHWFDPFSQQTADRMMALAKEEVTPFRGSPYRIGYFSDNEVGWWAGALFVFYSQKPADSATKQRWLALVREHYRDDWRAFAADFEPPNGVDSWDKLLAAEARTHMRAGGHGIVVVRKWTAMVAELYYTLSERAIRAADPEALYFGDRLPIYYDPAAIRAMAPHVDAIAMNYNVDASDGWLAHYFFDGLDRLSGGKPVLITEWFFAARENRTGNANNGHLMTVDTQAERARGAAAATLNFAALPQLVGTQWFQYYDHPKGGRPDGEDYNFGLVDVNDRPYEELTGALTAANRQALRLHATTKPQTVPERFVLPHADINVGDHTLADWPKPAGLLPPLKPSPDAVDFGEIYLSWSERGLAVATIGQDYFDIDLLTYDGAFPLSDAYNLELGVNAGGGPHRFTLFFIPPRTKTHDFPEMQAMLCAGSAAEAIRDGCKPVPGAESVYFGADQPRITAEMLIPWSALDSRPPAPGKSVRIEAAMTSWHRERWMSLSGRAPETALANPAGWRAVPVGNGLTVKKAASERRS